MKKGGGEEKGGKQQLRAGGEGGISCRARAIHEAKKALPLLFFLFPLVLARFLSLVAHVNINGNRAFFLERRLILMLEI